MSKEQSLEQEIEEIVCNCDSEDDRELAIATKDILKAIDSRLPKEKSRTVISSEIPDFSGSFRGGYNKALSDVRKELGL